MSSRSAGPDQLVLRCGARRARSGSVVKRIGGATRFDFGEWASDMASRANDDGTLPFVTISTGTVGFFNFVVGNRQDKRTLTLREARHEYVFGRSGLSCSSGSPLGCLFANLDAPFVGIRPTPLRA
jgi:hypothetical protein